MEDKEENGGDEECMWVGVLINDEMEEDQTVPSHLF